MYLHACQVRVTGGDSGLRCCVCVTYFERLLPPLCVDSEKEKEDMTDLIEMSKTVLVLMNITLPEPFSLTRKATLSAPRLPSSTTINRTVYRLNAQV